MKTSVYQICMYDRQNNRSKLLGQVTVPDTDFQKHFDDISSAIYEAMELAGGNPENFEIEFQ